MASKYYREDLKKLKERRSGISTELEATYKKNNKLVREVKKAIQELQNPTSVPELAEMVDYPANEIFFAIMCLRKFNKLEVVNKRGEYPLFAFKEGQK